MSAEYNTPAAVAQAKGTNNKIDLMFVCTGLTSVTAQIRLLGHYCQERNLTQGLRIANDIHKYKKAKTTHAFRLTKFVQLNEKKTSLLNSAIS